MYVTSDTRARIASSRMRVFAALPAPKLDERSMRPCATISVGPRGENLSLGAREIVLGETR